MNIIIRCNEYGVHNQSRLRKIVWFQGAFYENENAIFQEAIDEAMREYLARKPDASVVNLGCGLDTTFSRVDNGRILWYDLQKIKQALESVKRKETFTVDGLYNLSNGQFDDQLEVDAVDCDYLILEGLFSCHQELDGFIDLRIFLDVPEEVALSRAHDRDETVRHLDHDSWLQKKDIFYDHYLPFMESHKNRAHIILDPD